VVLRLLVATFLSWTLTACISSPMQAPDPMSQSSAVSVATPDFLTSPDTALRWYSDLIWIDDPEGRYERRADMLQQALQHEFEHKGYSFVKPGEIADYDVLAVAVLGDINGHQKVEQVFRMYPSLGTPARGYKRGTVLVALAPTGTKTIVWRGALEVFTDPGMQPIQVREHRIQHGAVQLLRSIPNYK